MRRGEAEHTSKSRAERRGEASHLGLQDWAPKTGPSPRDPSPEASQPEGFTDAMGGGQ